MSRRMLVGTCAIAVLLPGCSASLNLGGPRGDMPRCLQPYQGRPDHLDGSLVLAAQSVPTAALVPCVRSLPAGWTLRDFTAQRGRSRLWLDLGTANQKALDMTFTQTCDVTVARRTLSDEQGTLRFDEMVPDSSGYRATRFYTFPGGCVSYHFDVRGAAAGQAVRTISHALAFVDRNAIRRYVSDYTDGHSHLDPSPGR